MSLLTNSEFYTRYVGYKSHDQISLLEFHGGPLTLIRHKSHKLLVVLPLGTPAG